MAIVRHDLLESLELLRVYARRRLWLIQESTEVRDPKKERLQGQEYILRVLVDPVRNISHYTPRVERISRGENISY